MYFEHLLALLKFLPALLAFAPFVLGEVQVGGSSPQGGASPTPDPGANPGSSPTGGASPTPDQLKELKTQFFGAGVTAQAERTGELFGKHGLPVVMIDGKVDLTKTAEEIAKQLADAKAKPAASAPAAGAPTDRERELQDRLTALEQQGLKTTKQLQEREAALAQQMIDTQVSTAFAGLPIVDGYAETAMLMFKSTYTVTRLADGTFRVKDQAGNVMLDDEARPMTIAVAAQKFLESKPIFRKATVTPREGDPGSVNDQGKKIVTMEDMMAGRVSSEDLAKGKVVVRA